MILARVAKREWVSKSSPQFFVATADPRIIYMTYRSYSVTIEITEKNYISECKF